MSTLTKSQILDEIFYPESDGKPMADNTKQYEWIVTIKENLEAMLPNAFVAADLFWYPVRGNPKIVQAPDVMVAIGRPKGHRGSYRQWEEGGIVPQVVFEILSPNNTPMEMMRKERFYLRYGVQEYYIYDPDGNELEGYLQQENSLCLIDNSSVWVSPLLGIRFEPNSDGLEIYFPDGKRFLTVQQLRQRADEAEHLAQQERQRADEAEHLVHQERQRADEAEHLVHQERQRADEAEHLAQQERQRAQQLAAKLQALGIDPKSI